MFCKKEWGKLKQKVTSDTLELGFFLAARRRVTRRPDVTVRRVTGAQMSPAVERVAPREIRAGGGALRQRAVALLVVEIRRRLEYVPRHVHRPEVRVERLDGRLESEHELRYVALHVLALLGGGLHQTRQNVCEHTRRYWNT